MKSDVNDEETSSDCDYDEAVELIGHGRYNYLQLAACSIISNAVGVDMFGFGVILAAATCDLQLGVFETGLLASAPFAGIIFAFPWGYYADTQGRRRALLLSTSVGFLMAILVGFAPDWKVMLALKFIGCSFSTAGFNLTMTYLGECTGSKRRSKYLFIINSAELAAEFVFYAMAYLLLRLDFELFIPYLSISFRPWRLYALLLSVPLGLGTFLLLFLYESPKFLASRRDTEQALRVMRTMYRINGGNEDTYPVKTLKVPANEESTKDSFWSSIVNQTVPLFKPPLLWRTIQLFYLMAICCSTNYVFVMWYPTMVNLFFNSLSDDASSKSFCQRVVGNITVAAEGANNTCTDTHLSPNTIYSGLAIGVAFACLNLVASSVATWRRLVLTASLVVAAVSLVLVDLMTNPIASMIFFTLIQITAIGIGSVASYFVDLYPTAYRALVTSLGLTMGRLVSWGGVNLLGNAIVDYCSITFYGWAVFACSGIIASLLLPPDKRPDLSN